MATSQRKRKLFKPAVLYLKIKLVSHLASWWKGLGKYILPNSLRPRLVVTVGLIFESNKSVRILFVLNRTSQVYNTVRKLIELRMVTGYNALNIMVIIIGNEIRN